MVQEHARQPDGARHQALLEGIPHLVWQSRDGGRWFAASPQWEAFTGQNEAESRGGGWLEMIHPQDWGTTPAAWRKADESGVLMIEHRIRRNDGTYRWFQTRALPVPADALAGAERLWIGTSTDIDDLRLAEERIRYLALHDQLTETGNRRMLQDVLDRMTTPSAEAWSFNVLYLDLDDFKLVNDQFGHRLGDELLRQVGQRLKDALAEEDIVSRVGGGRVRDRAGRCGARRRIAAR